MACGSHELWGYETLELSTGEEGRAPDLEAYADIEAVAFSPDGHLLAAATYGGLRIWASSDWGTVKPTLVAKSPMGAYAIAFSLDGKSVATGSISKGVLVFDVQSGAPKWPSVGTSSISGIAYSRDGRLIASGEDYGDIKLWDAATGALVRTLHADHIWEQASTLAFFRDGRLAVGSYRRPGITIWDSESGALLQTLRGTASPIWPPGTVWSIAISPDDAWVAAGESDHSIRFWNKDSDAPARSIFGHVKDVLAVAFSPDGHQLASGGADHSVKIWANAP